MNPITVVVIAILVVVVGAVLIVVCAPRKKPHFELDAAVRNARGSIVKAGDPRYSIYNGSQSAHCCFAFTVVDRKKPDIIGGKQYVGQDGQAHFEAVCECYTEEDAKLICDALNASTVVRP